MNPELDQKLCADYPQIFKHRNSRSGRSLMRFGFACGDGWYTLLDNACKFICWPFEHAKNSYEELRAAEGGPRYKGGETVTAIDVERARLAMREAAEALPVAVQVKEKFGTLRFYYDGGNERAHTTIQFAEFLSGQTCEVCGSKGELRHGGWVRTLCDAHEEERQARQQGRRLTPKPPRNVRTIVLDAIAPHFRMEVIVGESIAHLGNAALMELVRPLVQRFNAEAMASHTASCADGRSVEESLKAALNEVGFVVPVRVQAPFRWDEASAEA